MEEKVKTGRSDKNGILSEEGRDSTAGSEDSMVCRLMCGREMLE